MRIPLFITVVLLTATLWLAGPSQPVQANDAEAEADLQPVIEIVEAAMQHVVEEDYADAYDGLAAHSIISAENFATLKIQTIQQRAAVRGQYGQPVNFEKIDTELLGSSLVRLRYLERCPRRGLLWEFVFYRGEKGWELYWVNFSDELQKAYD